MGRDGWSGAGCSGTGMCAVTMSEAREITATFTSTCSPLVLADQTVATTETWEACAIVAGPAFVVTGTGDATLHASTSVVLRNGFAVESGGVLTLGHS